MVSVNDMCSTKPYDTDEFRIFCYKVLPCPKKCVHNWSSCPFAHPGEKSRRRRDPRRCSYLAIPCPSMRTSQLCPDGDDCPYSHNVFEFWLHPSRYRTQMCQKGHACKRDICFFAHGEEELRVHRPASSSSAASLDADDVGVSEPSSPSSRGSGSSLDEVCVQAFPSLDINEGTRDTQPLQDRLDPINDPVLLMPPHLANKPPSPINVKVSLSVPPSLHQVSLPTTGPLGAPCLSHLSYGDQGGLGGSNPWAAACSAPIHTAGPPLDPIQTPCLPLQVTSNLATPITLVQHVPRPLQLSQPLRVPTYQEYVQMCLQGQVLSSAPQLLSSSPLPMLVGGQESEKDGYILTLDQLASLLQPMVAC